jgi:hypothetical protein
VKPTVFVNVKNDMTIAQEEIFGRALVDRQRTNPPMILAGRGVGVFLKGARLRALQNWTGASP